VQRRTQAERRAASRERVIDAAITVIGGKGYNGTTLAEIGQVAGCSRGLPHHYFGSKLELMSAVIEELSRRFQERVLQPLPPGQRGLDAVLGFAQDYLGSVAAAGPERMRTVHVLMLESLSVAPELRPLVAAMSEALRAQIRSHIETGIADGTVRPDAAPATQAVLILGLLRGVALQWMVDPAGIDLGAARAEIATAIREQLAPQSAS
jgi:AcrR family transcriptional regulator